MKYSRYIVRTAEQARRLPMLLEYIDGKIYCPDVTMAASLRIISLRLDSVDCFLDHGVNMRVIYTSDGPRKVFADTFNLVIGESGI